MNGILVAETPDGYKKCFQVAWEHEDPKTFDREQRALDEGMAELQMDGEIITLDSYLEKGIVL